MTLTAVNTDPNSENRMHSDDVARQYGFRSGLVPGVEVFEYMARAVFQRDPKWLSGGAGELRLLKPYYDGDAVNITVNTSGNVVSADDHATLHFERDNNAAELQEAPPYKALPERRPAASAESLAEGAILGSLRKTLANSESNPTKARELLELANRILMQNVVFEPWIHTSSVIHWSPGAADIVEVEARGRVIAQYERKGHGFVTLRLVLCDAQRELRPAAWIDHTAIWRYRKNPFTR